MSTTTSNLSLIKPDSNENVDISVINGNYDKIDEFAGGTVSATLSSPANGQILKYNSTTGKFENANNSYNLSELGDTNITSPTEGQILQYNATTNRWENKTGGSSGSTVVWDQIQATGTKIATVSIDGVSTDVYAPEGGGGFTPTGETYRFITTGTPGSASYELDVVWTDGSTTESRVICDFTNIVSGWTTGDYKNITVNWDRTNSNFNFVSKSGYFEYNDDYFAEGDTITTLTSGDITFEVVEPELGSDVSWTQVQLTGTKIAEIEIDGVSTNVYTPSVPTNTSDLTNDSNFVADATYVHTDNNYTTTEKNKLSGLVAVEANPSGTASTDLTKIAIGGTNYNIPSGGGGTTVVANPSGEATDELEKLQVGNTIYSLSTGGGSAKALSMKTKTYTGDGNSSYTLTLDDDPVMLWFSGEGGDNSTVTSYSTPIQTGVLHGDWFKSGGAGSLEGGRLSYDSSTKTLSVSGGSGDMGVIYNYNGGAYTLYYIVEASTGGGSGTSAVDMLWEYSDTYDITLAHPFTDYDFLVLEGNVYNNSGYKGGHIVSSTELEDIIDATKTSGVVYAFVGTIQQYANYYVTSSTGLEYKEGGARVLRVWGVKIGSGGGTEVIANPSEEPTDSLSSVQIGDTVYSIEGGGGGESWTDITGTLTAGQTSITLTSSKIKLNSVIDIYTDVFGVTPQNMQLSSSSLTIKFKPQASDVGVMVRVSKVVLPHTYDLPLLELELNKSWFAYDDVRGFTHVEDTQGEGLHIYGGEAVNDWTTSGSICIDLYEIINLPYDLTALKVHFNTFLLEANAGVRFFVSNTKYQGGQQGSDSMLRQTGLYQITSSDSTDSGGYITIPADYSTLSAGRYLYIIVMTGMQANVLNDYNNSSNGAFDIDIDGIDYVTGGGS